MWERTILNRKSLAILLSLLPSICVYGQATSDSDAGCFTDQLNDGERLIRSIFFGSRLTSVEQACVNTNAINRKYKKNDQNYADKQMLDQDFRRKVGYVVEDEGTDIAPLGSEYTPGFNSIERKRRAVDDKLPGYTILTSE